MKFITLILIGFLSVTSCKSRPNYSKTSSLSDENNIKTDEIIIGAKDFDAYLPLLENKRVGLVINQTSEIDGISLLDVLIEKNIDVKVIYAPEHGFRGEVTAGEHIDNSVDSKTGLPIVSIYGKNKKPSKSQLAGVDVLVFDIQDVGARFYTYISTLYYCIQAAGEYNKEIIVLDRPNPLGMFVDGPVLESPYKSFVGIANIPVLHGMTMAEIANYFNEEYHFNANLKVVKNKNYTHESRYSLPVKPSPNLPNMQSIYLYPSICWFEPTKISVGRGTSSQFQVIGGPDKNLGEFTFTPVDMPGAKNPVNEGVPCYGANLSNEQVEHQGLTFKYLIDFYEKYGSKQTFFTNEKFFNLLAGNNWLLKAIKEGKTEEEIKAMYEPDLIKFKGIREKYLLYP